MLVRRYASVVALFLFTWKNAQPFILLTANVADIKKIAQKFVTNELAEKLAQSIVTVIDNLNNNKETNLSKQFHKIEYNTDLENKAIFHDGRNRNKKISKVVEPEEVDQQRFKKVSRNRNDDNSFSDNRNPKSIYKNEHKKETSTYLKNWETSLQSQYVTKFFSAELNTPHLEKKLTSHQKRTRHSIQTQTTANEPKSTIHPKIENNYNYKSIEGKSHYAPKTKSNWSHESRDKNEKLFGDSRLPDRKDLHQRGQFMDANTGKHINKNTSTEQQSGLEPGIQIGKTKPLTTKHNFEQYDNVNYPKKLDYLATSGPVVLPAAPVGKQWWEKKMADNHQHRQNQAIETRTNNSITKSTIRPKIPNNYNYKSNEVKSRYTNPTIEPFFNPERTLKNKTVFDDNRSSDLKMKHRVQLMDVDGVESTKQTDKVVAKKNGETEKLPKTTKRERNEFDQYENLNYPKERGYLATSGPVVLPAAHVEKQWWEKDLPK